MMIYGLEEHRRHAAWVEHYMHAAEFLGIDATDYFSSRQYDD